MTIKKNHIISTVFSVTGLLIVSKLLGFVKQLVTASAFGATLETDLINLSQGLIGNIQYLLVQSVLSALIAVYLHTAQQGEDASRCFAFDVWKALTVFTAMVVLFVELCAPWLARLIAPSYPAEQIEQLSRYLRLFAPVLLLLTWIAVFNGLLHANKHFVPGEMISVHQSIFLIVLAAALARTLGVQVLVLSFFAYNLWNAGYMAILSRRYWTVSRGNPFRNPAVQELLRMMGPLLLGYSLVYINQMVDKMLVSGLKAGAVTALNYAVVLNDLVGTFISTFASMLFAYVTTRIAVGDADGAAQLTERTALLLSVIFLPITILTVLLSEEIVTIVYARGAFDAEAAAMTAQALMGYSLSFIPLALREVYSRVQYGYQDSKHPAVNSVIGIACNVTLSILLCRKFGVFGVTLASSVATLVIGMLNVQSARRTASFLSLKSLWNLTPNILIGGILSILLTWGCKQWLAELPLLIRLCLTTFFVFSGYSVLVIPAVWKTGLIKPCHFSRKQR